jgi:hypothetical protein
MILAIICTLSSLAYVVLGWLTFVIGSVVGKVTPNNDTYGTHVNQGHIEWVVGGVLWPAVWIIAPFYFAWRGLAGRTTPAEAIRKLTLATAKKLDPTFKGWW